MNIATVTLVVAALGVNFGWQPSPDDPRAYEVLMQVEPELVDVMADGREIPIESHVPASVAPIRSIRVVVGTQELPRTMIAAKGKSASKTDRIVRGQEPSPVEHSANFQNDPWGSSHYDSAATDSRQYDQRGATIGVEPIRTAQNSPWTIEGAQQTVSDAGNSLRNSVDTSVQQVNQGFNQLGQEFVDKTNNAATEFGNQLQNLTGLGGQSAAPTTANTPTTKQNWPAPPLAASPQSNPATAPAWTSIKSELAPPRLATPPLAGGVRVASNPAAGRAGTGPSFPAPPSVGAPQQRSLLTETTSPSSVREEDGDWNSFWGTGNAKTSTSGDDSDSVGMVPVPPKFQTSTASQPQTRLSPPPATDTRPIASPLDDRYGETNPPSVHSSSGADDWANFGRSQNDVFNDPRLPAATQPNEPPPSPAPQNESFTGTGQMTQPTIGTQPPAAQTNPAVQNADTPEEVPWKPLLAVSLALAGSIGANFYLGMSYAEARHRYRSLVAKTTHAFEKQAGLAA